MEKGIKKKPSSIRGKRLFFYSIANFCRLFIRPFFTEEIQVTGLEFLWDEEVPRKGPFLWLIGHVELDDFYNYLPLWLDLPHRPRAKAVIRHEFHHPEAFFSEQEKWLKSLVKTLGKSKLYQTVWNQFTLPVRRTRMTEGLSDEQISRQVLFNRMQLEKIIRDYENEVDIAIFPEGTTKTSGKYPDLHIGGTYTICRIQEEKGREVKIFCIGNTYDLMAGKRSFLGKKLNLVFCNIGQQFTYSPAPRQINESDEAYEKKDKAMLAHKIMAEFVDLNTITTSQLGAFYIFYLMEKDIDSFTKEELIKSVDSQVSFLRKIEDGRSMVIFDRALLNLHRKQEKIERFFECLKEREYIIMEGITAFINKDRVKQIPSSVKYFKKENPLLYTYNRISHVARLRPAVGQAIFQALNKQCRTS